VIDKDLKPARIHVSRDQQKILHPVLNWIRKHDSAGDWTTALDGCCAETIRYIVQSSWPLIVIPTEGPTKPFRFLRGSDPGDPTDAAIGIATEDIGLEDEGAALTHVAATFLLTRPEIADSPSRKIRALRTRLLELHLEAKAKQAGGTT
jgi:hypothetical protein